MGFTFLFSELLEAMAATGAEGEVPSLPEETWAVVFSFLDGSSVGRAAQVSKFWRTISLDNFVWNTLCTASLKPSASIIARMTLEDWLPPLLDPLPASTPLIKNSILMILLIFIFSG